ncbi:MAG TPA: molybdenum cofactor guanylyltransferase [Methylomusa anaerophila]|nr:molybdenum cofactor guanylyltransferase [Methylomusa anaerophila]HML89179.1 molybdenum cofactor guanylyltransferase [Methylomusa anaerophila]
MDNKLNLFALGQITPFILSGGKSRRMGTNKSFVKLGNQPLIEIMVTKLASIFDKKPVILTNSEEEYAYLNCEMVGDIIKNKGPLAGLHAALTWAPTQYSFVFACDMPFINGDFIRYMVNRLADEDILIPFNGESVEPLHAIYSKNCLAPIESCLFHDRRSIKDFFPAVTIHYIGEEEWKQFGTDLDCFMNINTVADLEKARSIWHVR